jgi:hypothetical protein
MLQPVNRLPPEILSHIARNAPNNRPWDAGSMIPLTHVCRYWRESIASTPENWTSISSRSRSLATVSLERAKSAPLEINLDTSSGRRWLSDLLTPYIKNVKTLNVDYLSVTEVKNIFPDFPQSMPNLLSLTLATRPGTGGDRFIDPFEPLSPPLRSLKLSGVSLYPSLLKLRTLTELDLHDPQFNLQLDTLLDFLEENRSLESAILSLRFTEPFLRNSRRRVAIVNRLRYLQITCFDVMDGQALISSIALSKGAELKFNSWSLEGVLSGISTTHLSNLLSPTFMEYRVNTRTIRLLGPCGTATFHSPIGSGIPFTEFPRLPLTNIRRLHLDTHSWELIRPGSVVFYHLSSFPALEALTVRCDTDLSRLLSTLF